MPLWFPSFNVIATFVAAGLVFGLGVYLTHRSTPLKIRRTLHPLVFATALWLVTFTLTTITPDLPRKLQWNILQAALLILLPSLWTLFVVETSGVSDKVLWRLCLILAVEPILMIGIMATNQNHLLYWQTWQSSPLGPYAVLKLTYGPAATLHMVYGDFLMMIATALLLRNISERANPMRRPAATLLLASMIPWLLMMSGNRQNVPANLILNLLPVTMILSWLVIVAGLRWPTQPGVIPIARKAIVDKMQDGIIILDKSGAIVDVNPAASTIFQKSVNALLGQPAVEVFTTTPGMQENYLADTMHRDHLRFTTRNGERHYTMQITALRDGQGQSTGQLVCLHDITDHIEVETALEQAREAAETASRTKSEFLANMSHELRTPLNTIIGYTDLTLMGTYGDITPLQQERLGQVSENGRHLADLINDLIDISRIEAHDLPLHLETIDPIPLLDNVIQSTEKTATSKELRIHSNIPDKLPMIRADRRRLDQVVSHLIHNAIKFTPEGYIVVHAGVIERRDTIEFPLQLPVGPCQWLLIAVQDTGIGIAQEDQSMIFENFRQVDGSHTRRYQGSGLGLTIAHRFTRLMNGHMWVESMLNQGSTMYVLLPVVDSDGSTFFDADLQIDEDAAPRHVKPHLN